MSNSAGRIVRLPERGIEEAALGQLVDLSDDALCSLSRDGALVPLNSAMRALCAEIEPSLGRALRHVEELPLEREDLAAIKELLLSDENEHRAVLALRLASGQRVVRTRFVADSLRGGWLVCLRDETEQRRAAAALARHERVRMLADLAAGIARDVEAAGGAMLSFAEHLGSRARDDDERAFLDRAARDTREAVAMLKSLHRLLREAPHERVSVSLEELITRSVRLAEKSGPLRGCSMRVALGSDLPNVRVVPEDAVAALVQLLQLARACGAADAIEVVADAEVASRGRGLPERCYGVVRVVGVDDPARAQALARVLDAPAAGLAPHVEALAGEPRGLVRALVALRFAGARFEVERRRARCSLALWLPAARRPTRAT